MAGGINKPGRREVDETYIGGKEGNRHAKNKLHLGRGGIGKAAVVGAKDRKTNKVRAKVVKATDAKTLQKFVADTAADGATVYTDDAAAYKGMPFDHMSVRHSVGEWQGLLDGVRYVRYYGALHQRYNRRHQIFRFMLGLAGVCTVLPLVPLIPSIVAHSPVLSL